MSTAGLKTVTCPIFDGHEYPKWKAMMKITAACPTFEGKDFPFWKTKMQMHLQAIDNDLWYIVENGIPYIPVV